MRAITRWPSPAMAEAELTHMARVPIDLALAGAQHAAYCAALAAAGCVVAELPVLAGHPDCAFVEDVAVILPEAVILCRPGAESRRGEAAAIVAALPTDRPLHRVEAPGTIDGGDVLVVGRDIFIGLSSRTNAEAIAAVTAATAGFGYKVIAVPVPGALHLKTAVTALADDLLVINPAWVDGAVFGRRLLTVDPAEPFGANVLHAGTGMFHAAASPLTRARIIAAGFAVTPIDISEFAKAEAGLTCLSLIVPPAV